jgi:hypothetical protein
VKRIAGWLTRVRPVSLIVQALTGSFRAFSIALGRRLLNNPVTGVMIS